MYLTLTFCLTAILFNSNTDKEAIDNSKISIEVEKEPTKEDLEEFVKEQGYENSTEYFEDYIGDDKEELKLVLGYVKQGDIYLVESHIDVYCNDREAFKKFLLNKYQQQLVSAFVEKITSSCENGDIDISL